ncbi:MAG: thiol peroxidase [Deltaproteobacteria bacterium]|nr:thiol peroxidase [Deltaproteobacteria bacterium]
MERKGVVTFKGKGLTLSGGEIKTGSRAPGFTSLDRDNNEKGLKDFEGRVIIISVTPSLDTPVCDMQARRFNEEAARLPADVAVINMSMDLPFAISRFCASAGIERVITLSDHRDASFGTAYGVLIKELRLLARAVFVIDAAGIVRYAEIVPELTNPPDYVKALGEARNRAGVKNPPIINPASR